MKYWCALKWKCLFPVVLLVALFSAGRADAQTLTFSNHREVSIPESAVLRIGPFYSSVIFSQSAGYRYTKGEGAGIDYLFENQRGVFLKDGSDYPLISTLDLRNYLIITRNMDLDISLRASYAHYPMKTQEDEFVFDPVEEGVFGMFSSEFRLTPYVKGTIYNNARYRTDYVDLRGLDDRYGGSAYEHLQNEAGLNLDWEMMKDKNLGLTFSRTDVIPRDEKYNEQQSVCYKEGLSYQQILNELVLVGASASSCQYSYTEATNRPDTAFSSFVLSSTLKPTKRSVITAAAGYSQVSDSGESTAAKSSIPDGTVIGSLSLKTELAEGLSHQLSIERSHVAGFVSASEINDTFGYELNWKGDGGAAVGLTSEFMDVRSSEARLGEYSDWRSGVNATFPLTEIIALVFESYYDVRSNKNVPADSGVSPELTGNYDTWSSRLGTTVTVFQNDASATRQVVFATYLQHVERISDSDSLAYKRDVFVATFTYTHKF